MIDRNCSHVLYLHLEFGSFCVMHNTSLSYQQFSCKGTSLINDLDPECRWLSVVCDTPSCINQLKVKMNSLNPCKSYGVSVTDRQMDRQTDKIEQAFSP